MKTLEILKQLDLKPSKSRGQNFLIDNNIVDKIITTAKIEKKDNILEIGPGLGVLTKKLTDKARKVLAIEKDKKLFDYLQTLSLPNAELVNMDALDFDFSLARQFFQNQEYRVVANLPYSITSAFFRLFLDSDYPPTDMTVMIQREVAERIVEREGKSSLLSLAVGFFAEAKIAFHVSPTCFFPAPKVDSSVIILKMKKEKTEQKNNPICHFDCKGEISNWRKYKNYKHEISPCALLSRDDKKEGKIEITNQNKRATEETNLSFRLLMEKSQITKTKEKRNKEAKQNEQKQVTALLKNSYFKFIKEAFSSKRKQMLSNLKSFPREKVKELLFQLGKDEKIRAEDLNLHDFLFIIEKII